MPKPSKKTSAGSSSASRASKEKKTEPQAHHGPRPAWRGSISFGLVSVPVELYPATRPHKLRSRMLDEDGAPLTRHFYCPEDDTDLEDDDIVRGYELPDGKYITVEDEELEALAPKKSREIDLRLFTDLNSLNPAWFERAYVLVPTDEGTKAYRLLAEVMQRTERVGIATFVLREREYIIAIVSDGHCLLGETLRFADEIRSTADLELPESDSAPKALVEKLKRALKSKHSAKIDSDELVDPAHAKLEKLIETKRKRGEVTEAHEKPSPDSAAIGGAEVIDLMQVLQRSLKAKRRS